MKLAVLEAPGEYAIVDEPVPTIGTGDVLVRVRACGVCASELDAWRGLAAAPFPIYPGHEVSGVVERVGTDVTTVAPGDPVAVWTTARGFAEYVAVKEEYCVPTGTVALDVALAEPLGCAVNAVDLADVRLGDDVVVIGAGFMGNLVQQLVALRGPRHLIVADTRRDALERAADLGATHTVDVGVESLRAIVDDLTGGVGADISLEVTGSQVPLAMLGDVTRMSGKIGIVGYHQGNDRQIPLGQWNWMALQLVNAHFREVSTILGGMRAGMRVLEAGHFSLDDLVTHRFDLPEIGEAFQIAQEKPDGFVKATVLA